MIMDSISHWFTGWHIDCTTNASLPRTDSRYRTKISPLANWYASVGVGATPRCAPISSASSGNARPEKSIRVFLLSPMMAPIGSVLPSFALGLTIRLQYLLAAADQQPCGRGPRPPPPGYRDGAGPPTVRGCVAGRRTPPARRVARCGG